MAETKLQRQYRILIDYMDSYYDCKDSLTAGQYEQFKDLSEKESEQIAGY